MDNDDGLDAGDGCDSLGGYFDEPELSDGDDAGGGVRALLDRVDAQLQLDSNFPDTDVDSDPDLSEAAGEPADRDAVAANGGHDEAAQGAQTATTKKPK